MYDKYVFGFDRETRLAWRLVHGEPKENKEFSLPLPAADGTGQAVTAVWADGMKWDVPASNVGAGRGSNTVLQQGQSFELQAKRFCSRHGDLPGPQPGVLPRNHVILKEMMKIMVPVAEKFQSGELQVDELQAYCEKLMEEAGYEPMSKTRAAGATRKRPVAKEDSASLSKKADAAEDETSAPAVKKKKLVGKQSEVANTAVPNEEANTPRPDEANTVKTHAKAAPAKPAKKAAVKKTMAMKYVEHDDDVPTIPTSMAEELSFVFDGEDLQDMSD